MRLHHLRIQAFLAFPGTEAVDFDRLHQSGLFLLQGRTGAGKTTILDAIVFALFGEVPGAREGGAKLRCDHADPGSRTEVELEVTLRGRRVRITRSPEQERPKLRGEGTTTEAHKILLVAVEDGGSESVLATRHDEARAELGDLLGMSCEQFCQVVLLPQGGFAKFLHASSDQREELLRDLFDVACFTEAERWLKERQRACDQALRTALNGVQDIVSRASQEAAADPPEGWEADPPIARGWLDEQLVVAEAGLATAHSAAHDIETARATALSSATAARRLADLQREHREAVRELEQWLATRSRRREWASELETARRAAPAAAYTYTLAEAEAKQAEATAIAERAAASAREAHPEAGEDPSALRQLAGTLRESAARASALIELEAEVEGQQQTLENLQAQIRDRQRNICALTEKITEGQAARGPLTRRAELAAGAAAKLDLLHSRTTEAAERAQAASIRDRLRAQVGTAREALLTARETALEARERLGELTGARLAEMAAALAAELVTDQACPVCGSQEHPFPARSPQAGVPSETELTSASTRAEKLERMRDASSEEHARLQRELATAEALAGEESADALLGAGRRAEDELESCRAMAGACALLHRELELLDADLEAWVAAREDQRAQASGLQAALSAHSSSTARNLAAVETARAGAASISARILALNLAADAVEQAASAGENLARCREEARQARERANEAARALGFSDTSSLIASRRTSERCSQLEAELSAWDAELARRRGAAARPELEDAAGLPAPELRSLEAEVKRLERDAASAQAEQGKAQKRHGGLRELRSELGDALRPYEEAREELRQVREMAELTNGTSASNRLRIRLSAYVLAARLEEVAEAATLRLQRMSASRYSLVHTDGQAKGHRRGGLDLRVRDAWTGHDRAPSSLSGGETFLASLALALGLADVVTAEAGASSLETLFIDEGFGSLDDEGTLEEVMDVLDSLRDGGRSVGVVSHIGAMRERIPTQLRIEKGIAGSHIIAPAGDQPTILKAGCGFT
jgi:exonuclease SbcC